MRKKAVHSLGHRQLLKFIYSINEYNRKEDVKHLCDYRSQIGASVDSDQNLKRHNKLVSNRCLWARHARMFSYPPSLRPAVNDGGRFWPLCKSPTPIFALHCPNQASEKVAVRDGHVRVRPSSFFSSLRTWPPRISIDLGVANGWPTICIKTTIYTHFYPIGFVKLVKWPK